MEGTEEERQADDWVQRYGEAALAALLRDLRKTNAGGAGGAARRSVSGEGGAASERALKQRRLVQSRGPRLVTVTGPNVHAGGEQEEMQTWGGVLAARTISTYPMRGDASGMRDGDPICDRYGAVVYENRSVVVVADGCNWGVAPMMAAQRARDAVLEYLNEKDRRIRDVAEAALYLLRSFSYAHRKMSQRSREQENVGTSTLIASMVAEMEADPQAPHAPQWVFVGASVGDCKAFHVCGASHRVTDITDANRGGQEHANDCGGRLGPTQADGGPDLRNLNTFFFPCRAGDFVVCMSDGVHDNLHPRMLGIAPRSLGLDADEWGALQDTAAAESIVVNFRTQFFHDYVVAAAAAAAGGQRVTCAALVERALEHSSATTLSSRQWMEANPGRRLPKDYERFPGKMDHTTMVVARVGFAGSPPHAAASSAYTSAPAGAAAASADAAPPHGVTSSATAPPRTGVAPAAGTAADVRGGASSPALLGASAQRSLGATEWARRSPEMAASPSKPARADPKAGAAALIGATEGRTARARTLTSPRLPTNVPLAVSVTQSRDQIAIYCRATAKSKFECIAKPDEVVLVVTPSKLFALGEGESVLGGIDELNQPYKRTIALPADARVDIRSKRMAYDPDMGIITILFRRIPATS